VWWCRLGRLERISRHTIGATLRLCLPMSVYSSSTSRKGALWPTLLGRIPGNWCVIRQPSPIQNKLRTKGELHQKPFVSDFQIGLWASNCDQTPSVGRKSCHMPNPITAQPGTSPVSSRNILLIIFFSFCLDESEI
jgi:hypothetical protein